MLLFHGLGIYFLDSGTIDAEMQRCHFLCHMWRLARLEEGRWERKGCRLKEANGSWGGVDKGSE